MEQLTGHAEMDYQHRVVIEGEKEELSSTPCGGEPASDQAAFEL
jgi:hypothetical protein